MSQMYTVKSSIISDIFTTYCPNYIPFISFKRLIALWRSSNHIVKFGNSVQALMSHVLCEVHICNLSFFTKFQCSTHFGNLEIMDHISRESIAKEASFMAHTL